MHGYTLRHIVKIFTRDNLSILLAAVSFPYVHNARLNRQHEGVWLLKRLGKEIVQDGWCDHSGVQETVPNPRRRYETTRGYLQALLRNKLVAIYFLFWGEIGRVNYCVTLCFQPWEYGCLQMFKTLV